MSRVSQWINATRVFFLGFVFFAVTPAVVFGYSAELLVTVLFGIVAGKWLMVSLLAE